MRSGSKLIAAIAEPDPPTLPLIQDGRPPDPEATLRPGARGLPVELADGRAWLLGWGGLDRALDPARDAIFDGAAINGRYLDCDAEWFRVAAVLLLRKAHDLTLDQAVELVRPLDWTDLIHPIERALGLSTLGSRRTYSRWARAALVAAGIDPEEVDPELMPLVIGTLEAAGRTLPRTWIEAVEAAERRRR
jgi:hypothetical protein